MQPHLTFLSKRKQVPSPAVFNSVLIVSALRKEASDTYE